MVDSRKIYTAQELGKFLRENKISPTEAVDIIQKYKLKQSRGDNRTYWKMFRFTLYIWQRHRDQQKNRKLPTRTDTITRVVQTAKFKRLYDTFPQPKFNEKAEVSNLLKLVGDKRQDNAFKEGKYKYEGTSKVIPQGHINELR